LVDTLSECGAKSICFFRIFKNEAMHDQAFNDSSQ
jgi:hypothetical protein